MRVVVAEDAESRLALLKWVAARIPHAPNLWQDSNARAIGVVTDTGQPAAGVIFNNYIPEDGTIQVHLAAINPLWTRNNTIRAILHYPFCQLGVNKVWGATPQDMGHVLQVNRKMGFTQEGILRKHIRGRNAVITGLLKREYMRRYWPDLENQKAA